MRTFLKCGKMVKIVCLRSSCNGKKRKEKKRKKERRALRKIERERNKERERERETFFVRRVRGDTRVMMMRLLYMNELTYGMQTGHFKRASTDHLQVAKVRS